MTIICLEGASAIGKTTAATYMANELGFVRVPEVNELYERPAHAAWDWYFHMQIKRWQLAQTVSRSGKVVILDGDHLQPIWYNWIFNDENLQPLAQVLAFYQNAFSQGEIEFPHAYVVLNLAPEALLRRKTHDTTRSRRNFNKHLRLIAPQHAYFKALSVTSPHSVEFAESISPTHIANLCRSICQNSKQNTLNFLTAQQFVIQHCADEYNENN